MTDCKKPSVAFWATVGLVVVLVGYPLSFGPACWITSRISFPHSIFEAVYLPLGWCTAKIGNHAWGIVVPYARAGMSDDSAVLVWTGSPVPSRIGMGRGPSHWEWRNPEPRLPFQLFSR